MILGTSEGQYISVDILRETLRADIIAKGGDSVLDDTLFYVDYSPELLNTPNIGYCAMRILKRYKYEGSTAFDLMYVIGDNDSRAYATVYVSDKYNV